LLSGSIYKKAEPQRWNWDYKLFVIGGMVNFGSWHAGGQFPS
jgi:hypothetical protein